MLDVLFIKNNLSKTISSLEKKNFQGEKIIEKIISLDDSRINTQKKSNYIQEKININSKKIGELYQKKKNQEADKLKLHGIKLKEELKVIIKTEKKIKKKLNNLLITIPNLPHLDVPGGKL